MIGFIPGALSVLVPGPLRSSWLFMSGMLLLWNFLRIESASLFESVLVSFNPPASNIFIELF